jgi:hypothetical protein
VRNGSDFGECEFMSSSSGVTQAGQSLQTAWNRIGSQTEALTDQLANGDATSADMLAAVVQLKALKLQAAVAGEIFKTLNDMASELLLSPRK